MQSQDCTAQSQNPETARQSQDCTLLGLHNLDIVEHQCAISRSHGTGAQSQDCTISVACAIEPRSSFKFPSSIKVRNSRKEHM